MAEEVIPAFPANFQVLPLREKRLGHDLQGMLTDPPEGEQFRITTPQTYDMTSTAFRGFVKSFTNVGCVNFPELLG